MVIFCCFQICSCGAVHPIVCLDLVMNATVRVSMYLVLVCCLWKCAKFRSSRSASLSLSCLPVPITLEGDLVDILSPSYTKHNPECLTGANFCLVFRKIIQICISNANNCHPTARCWQRSVLAADPCFVLDYHSQLWYIIAGYDTMIS